VYTTNSHFLQSTFPKNAVPHQQAAPVAAKEGSLITRVIAAQLREPATSAGAARLDLGPLLIPTLGLGTPTAMPYNTWPQKGTL